MAEWLWALLILMLSVAGFFLVSWAGDWIGHVLARQRRWDVVIESAAANDTPLIDPSDDQLGYAPFARGIAEGIRELSAPTGFVLAIFGRWGSGKTTLLNFIEHYLKEDGTKDRIDVVRFNPWWFSDREDLTRRFFDELQTATSGRRLIDTATSAEIRRLSGALAQSSALSGLARIGLFLLGPRSRDVAVIKSTLAKRLQARGTKVIIFIDDIDRLTPEDARDMFRLVKGVGDFPNVVYVLALDREMTMDALNEGTESATGYLEKIVQASFDLPVPDKVGLRRMFFEDLDELLANTQEDLFDQERWPNVYWQVSTIFSHIPALSFT